MGSRNKGSEFKSRWSEKLSLLHVVNTNSGVHPASYPIGTGCSFPGKKSSQDVNHLQLVLRSRKRGSINQSPIHLHGVVLKWLSTGTSVLYLTYDDSSFIGYTYIPSKISLSCLKVISLI
jgi:hypothetical protein